MASTTYKSRGNSDHLICVHLVAGFTGQLKGWQDNALTEKERIYIQTSLDERGNQNSVHTPIFAITKHFLGDLIAFQACTSEILQNIRCGKLNDYRWSKEVYFAKAHTRPDVNQPDWKKRFLNGLPKSFSQRIQLRIKEMYNGVIPYDSLTYGQLSNFINQEALNLCSLIKVNATLKKDLKTSKKELESFCAHYGYGNPIPPSAKQENFYRSKKKRLNKKYSKFKEESFYKKPKHKKYSKKKY